MLDICCFRIRCNRGRSVLSCPSAYGGGRVLADRWWRMVAYMVYVLIYVVVDVVVVVVVVNLYLLLHLFYSLISLYILLCWFLILTLALTPTNFSVDLNDFNDDRNFVSSNNRVGSNYSFFAQRQDLPHEMDTTNHLDGNGNGGSDVSDGMLMVYFWGLSVDLDNNYRYNPDVRHVSTIQYTILFFFVSYHSSLHTTIYHILIYAIQLFFNNNRILW